MKKSSKGGQRSQVKALRWSAALAASEFGLSPKTVATRLKASGVLAGEDGLFSTVDVHNAICGDLEKEKLRKLTQEANKVELEVARERGLVLDKADFVKRYEAIYAAMRQRILSSKLSDADKDALLSELHQLHSA